MAEILIDSYSETNADNITGQHATYREETGQSFTASFVAAKAVLSSCKFHLKKAGLPTGNVVARLYAHSGTYGTSSLPTGSILATSDNFDVSTLTTTSQLITFTFTGANRYKLIKGTYYCILLYYAGGNVDNQNVISIDGSSPAHSGNAFWAGTAQNLYDLCFYVYGTDIVGGAFLMNFI
jgi:hypothetical protein